jgi:hypothetical protein
MVSSPGDADILTECDGAVQRRGEKMAQRGWVAENYQGQAGRVIGSGQCVDYVRAASGLGHTSTWRRGERVRGSAQPAGTVIATFGAEGRYENRTDGSSHTAILDAIQTDGLLVHDQWKGHPVQQRLIRFKAGRQGTPNNDGDAYYSVVTDEPAAAAA